MPPGITFRLRRSRHVKFLILCRISWPVVFTERRALCFWLPLEKVNATVSVSHLPPCAPRTHAHTCVCVYVSVCMHAFSARKSVQGTNSKKKKKKVCLGPRGIYPSADLSEVACVCVCVCLLIGASSEIQFGGIARGMG